MTNMKTTIELAREIGLFFPIDEHQLVKRFAELIRADEREKLPGASVEPVGYFAWRDGKPYWDEDCVASDAIFPLDDTDDRTSMPIYTAEALAARVAQAQAWERERAIRIAVEFGYIKRNDLDDFADAIRARGEQT